MSNADLELMLQRGLASTRAFDEVDKFLSRGRYAPYVKPKIKIPIMSREEYKRAKAIVMARSLIPKP